MMRRMLRLRRPLAIVLAATLSSAPLSGAAWAQSPADLGADAARAAELRKLGNEAMDHLEPARALGYYSEAYGLTRDPALLYNKGRALQALENYPEALDAFEEFAQKATPELRAKVDGLEKLIDDLRRRIGTLEIVCNVDGGELRVKDAKGERVLGKLKAGDRFRMLAGKKEISISREGYFPEARTIDVPGGGIARVDVTLASKAVGGRLRVSSPVAGALVSVDGRPIGVAPADVSVNAGAHRVVVQRDGYETAETTALVETGEERRVDVPLAQRSSVFGRWWFWTGVGAIVAGGVVTTIVLITPRSPDSGSIPPGTVKTDALLRF